MKVIFLMVEIGARDSLLKSILAAHLLAHSDCIVIIATQAQIRFITAHSGIVGVTLQNSCNSRFASEYQNLFRSGFRIATIDEEATYGINEPETYLDERFDDSTASYVHTIFCASTHERKLITIAKPHLSPKLCTVGIPAFDLALNPYRRLFSTKSLQIYEEYGDFILYCSALGGANIHPINLSDGLEAYFSAHATPHAAQRRRRVHHIHTEVMSFVAPVLQQLAQSKSQNIVVRPHPAEDWSPWYKLSKSTNNIHIVEPFDSVYPWLITARSLIHYGCTTALQYHALRKRAISLYPPSLLHSLPDLANVVSRNCTSYSQLTNELFQDRLRTVPDPHFASYTRRYIANIDNPRCMEDMASKLTDLSRELSASYSLQYVTNQISTLPDLQNHCEYSARTMHEHLDYSLFCKTLAKIMNIIHNSSEFSVHNLASGLYVISNA